MKLYYAPGACSQAPHIVLREAGLGFATERVDLKTKKTETGADYDAINPKSYVPALLLDDGQVLTEVAAVVQYVADLAPQKRLAPPAGSFERVRLQEWLAFISSEIHKGYGPLWKGGPEEAQKAAKARLAHWFGWLDAQLVGRSFLMGEEFTVADAYLFVVAGWSRHFAIGLDACPDLQSYLARVGARPAVQAARAAEGL